MIVEAYHKCLNIVILLLSTKYCVFIMFSATECPTDSDWYYSQPYCYFVSDANLNWRRSWADADDWCKANGAHLVSIHSDDEQAFLNAVVSYLGALGYFLWKGLCGDAAVKTPFLHSLGCSTRPPFFNIFQFYKTLYFNQKSHNIFHVLFCSKCLILTYFQFLILTTGQSSVQEASIWVKNQF